MPPKSTGGIRWDLHNLTAEFRHILEAGTHPAGGCHFPEGNSAHRRWCRCARPPAMGCDPSGVGSGVETNRWRPVGLPRPPSSSLETSPTPLWKVFDANRSIPHDDRVSQTCRIVVRKGARKSSRCPPCDHPARRASPRTHSQVHGIGSCSSAHGRVGNVVCHAQTALACGGMSTRANLPISRTACRRRFEFSTMAMRR